MGFVFDSGKLEGSCYYLDGQRTGSHFLIVNVLIQLKIQKTFVIINNNNDSISKLTSFVCCVALSGLVDRNVNLSMRSFTCYLISSFFRDLRFLFDHQFATVLRRIFLKYFKNLRCIELKSGKITEEGGSYFQTIYSLYEKTKNVYAWHRGRQH